VLLTPRGRVSEHLSSERRRGKSSPEPLRRQDCAGEATLEDGPEHRWASLTEGEAT